LSPTWPARRRKRSALRDRGRPHTEISPFILARRPRSRGARVDRNRFMRREFPSMSTLVETHDDSKKNSRRKRFTPAAFTARRCWRSFRRSQS
jgi:hypothetical protein